jgi:predicted TIM-barrel fold metal-dependent hydrolase
MIIWARMKIDVHQHLWTDPLIEALAARRELPFIRGERGLTVLYLAGERPYVIDRESEELARRAELVEQDGLDRALVCLSSPIGIEGLSRSEAAPLLDAFHEGALALGSPFGVWGAIALDRPDADDVDRLLERGCVGLSLPAGAIAGVDQIARLRPVLERVEHHDVPLFVHPGPGRHTTANARHPECSSLTEPLWWPALTDYVAGLQSAWHAFLVAGRSEHPALRVVFSMLAGLAPLHAERLSARGGPEPSHDPLLFYETSSYGPRAVRALERVVGAGQILYGSDRPVVAPGDLVAPHGLDWSQLADGARRALGAGTLAVAG